MTSDAIPANEPLRPTADDRPATGEPEPVGGEPASAEPTAGSSTAEATAEPTTAEATTAEAIAVDPSADPAAATDVVEANAALAAAQAGAPAETKTSARRATFARRTKRFVRWAAFSALLIGGIALGYQRYLMTQPVEQPTGDPVTSGVQPTVAVQEFIVALGSNDADAIRAAVPSDPYKLLTNEMERWSFGEVTAVETLSTYVDGPRSSTAVILRGTSTDGSPLAINLVVQTMDGAIVSFR
jgi:hypothetical protein